MDESSIVEDLGLCSICSFAVCDGKCFFYYVELACFNSRRSQCFSCSPEEMHQITAPNSFKEGFSCILVAFVGSCELWGV